MSEPEELGKLHRSLRTGQEAAGRAQKSPNRAARWFDGPGGDVSVDLRPRTSASQHDHVNGKPRRRVRDER